MRDGRFLLGGGGGGWEVRLVLKGIGREGSLSDERHRLKVESRRPSFLKGRLRTSEVVGGRRMRRLPFRRSSTDGGLEERRREEVLAGRGGGGVWKVESGRVVDRLRRMLEEKLVGLT